MIKAMIIPIIVLAIVFVLIATRRIGNIKLQIWQIMLFGAIAVLVTGQISPLNALLSINLDVILFLFGMFIVGEALIESGYITHLSYKLFKRAKSPNQLLLTVLFGMGIASAFLMNDTLAIIGPAVVLILAKQCKLPPKLMLLALAFAVTIGSVMSPIGNPQNVLVAINGNVTNPFVTFFRYLLLPSMVNLFIAFVVLKIFYRKDLQKCVIEQSDEPIRDHKLAMLSKLSLVLIAVLITAKIVTVLLNIPLDFRLTYIALIPAVPIVILSPRRIEVLKKIDWRTLIFFAAMFILMESVWESGIIQSTIAALNVNVTSIVAILLVSTLLSQLISNVPMVALYLPMLMTAGASTKELMALAAGSTIAGNLFILGAASNIIIIQNAERKFGETITFLDFAKIGIILTAINLFVYWLFLMAGS
jgi:Na+/H+ antiporter NhaD/arsenite permease-like protein